MTLSFSSEIIEMSLPVFLDYILGCTYKELKEITRILEEYRPVGIEQYVHGELHLAQQKLTLVWNLLKKYERVLSSPARNLDLEA